MLKTTQGHGRSLEVIGRSLVSDWFVTPTSESETIGLTGVNASGECPARQMQPSQASCSPISIIKKIGPVTSRHKCRPFEINVMLPLPMTPRDVSRVQEITADLHTIEQMVVVLVGREIDPVL